MNHRPAHSARVTLSAVVPLLLLAGLLPARAQLNLDLEPELTNLLFDTTTDISGEVALLPNDQFQAVAPSAHGQLGVVGQKPDTSSSNLRLDHSTFGYNFSTPSPGVLFASVLEPPRTAIVGGQEVDAADNSFWASEPVDAGQIGVEFDVIAGAFGTDVTPPTTAERQSYYWSPHSQQVYASQGGRVRIVWRSRGFVEPGKYTLREEIVFVASATERPVRRIYWTEDRYTGPTVSIPENIVSEVEIVANSRFPLTVPNPIPLEGLINNPSDAPQSFFIYDVNGVEHYVAVDPTLDPSKNVYRDAGNNPVDPDLLHASANPPAGGTRRLIDPAGPNDDTNTVVVNLIADAINQAPNDTLWLDSQGQLRAYNREGRVMMELLGTVVDAGSGQRESLGIEVVDVIRQASALPATTLLGEQILPHPLPVTGPQDFAIWDVATADGTEAHYVAVDANLDPQENVYRDAALEVVEFRLLHRATEPPEGGTPTGEVVSLTASELTPFQVPGETFVELHVVDNAIRYYATRENSQPNRVQFYWREEDTNGLGILWPKSLNSYRLEWPDDGSFDAYFARSTGGTDPATTFLPFPPQNSAQLIFQDDPSGTAAEITAQQNLLVNLGGAGDHRSLVRFNSGSDFWYARIFSTTDEARRVVQTKVPVKVGDRLVPPPEADSASGFAHAGYIDPAYGTAYSVSAYQDPFVVGVEEAEKGAIIPVNARPGDDELRVWWFEELRPREETSSRLPGDLDDVFRPVFVPSHVVDYKLSWPAEDGGSEFEPNFIFLDSNDGTEELPSEIANGQIYFQNDDSLHGYNPNEEHALMLAGRGFALRDDLNVGVGSPDPAAGRPMRYAAYSSSAPFVLIEYSESNPDGDDETADPPRPNMEVFAIDRGDLTFPWRAGLILQGPMPLPVLAPPLRDVPETDLAGRPITVQRSKNIEVTPLDRDPPPTPVANSPAPEFLDYRRFTFEDRKGTKWIYRGPHAGPADPSKTVDMKFYYKTQPGFDFPNLMNPPDGTIVPYLRPFTVDGNDNFLAFVGDPITGDTSAAANDDRVGTQVIKYIPYWPDLPPAGDEDLAREVPVLQFAETLGLPKFGLPQVRGQTSARILYQQSLTPAASPKPSAVLHDPTVQKTADLPDDPATTDPNAPGKIPPSIATSQSGGKTFFPMLPTHLQERFFFDPLIGLKGKLVFRGEFVDAVAGEDYFLLNVLSDADEAALKGLVDPSDPMKGAWEAAIDALTVELSQFVEDIFVRGTYTRAPETPMNPHLDYNGKQLVQVSNSDQAVDSYALTAVGNGEGYLTLLAGNGSAFTPEGDPVAMHIIRVGERLYEGEVKVIVDDNPLSENVTVSHTGDFAAKTEDYEFQWRKAPPVDGQPPSAFSIEELVFPSGGFMWTGKRLDGDGTESADLGTVDLNTPIWISAEDPGPPAPRSSLELRSTFTLPGDTDLRRAYLGLSLPDTASVVVMVNGVETMRHGFGNENDLVPIADGDLTGDAAAMRSGPDAVDKVFLVGPRSVPLEPGSDPDNQEITLIFRSSADLDPVTMQTPPASLDFRMVLTARDDGNAETAFPVLLDTNSNRYFVSGASIDTLGDNYYIMRYRANDTNHPTREGGAEGWSRWTRPALVEGWIKRVLAEINPFNQRFTDFFENAIDTEVSLLTLAGTRWEGDVALNLDAVQEAGLIEIYETVFRRGADLSIEAGIDYPPANDALLLAAGYLADLYMALGNEAFADATNPTIAFDAQAIGTVAEPNVPVDFEAVFRNTSTARFAFQGQVPSLIDEELALLRGRDDFLVPGIQTRPAYNRLYWNYTRGIDAGEVIYALNYNITERDGDDTADGRIDAADAQRMFPQGHGDAYGHYLTALTNYYRLITHDDFTWGTRSEAVNILDQPVSVDYLDERKFAAAAAALARTATQIQRLEHRKSYQNVSGDGWTHLQDLEALQREANPNPPKPIEYQRRWGFDDWSSRAGQGAYYHWVTANAILPEIDDDPNHTGIQIIDRTTVPELGELAALGEDIQQQLDSANLKFNPLDLADDSLLFDISPQDLADGKTHFEQVYERAVQALQNASTVFERATDSTRLLRSLENQNQELNAAVIDEERAFTVKLWDIYGVPYPGHTGPGQTYPQGYDGPDFFKFMYIDRPFAIFEKEYLFNYGDGTRTFNLFVSNQKFEDLLSQPLDLLGPGGDFDGTVTIEFKLRDNMGPYQLADPELGRRPSLGSLQDTLNAVRLEEEKLYRAVNGMEFSGTLFIAAVDRFIADLENEVEIRALRSGVRLEQFLREELRAAFKALKLARSEAQDSIEATRDFGLDSTPTVVGVANDPSPPARIAVWNAYFFAAATSTNAAAIAEAKDIALDVALDIFEFGANETVEGLQWSMDLRAKAADLKSQYRSARGDFRDVDAQYVSYIRALEAYRNELCNGGVVQSQREVFRKRAAGVVQGYRTRDVAFRAFRTESLEQYHELLEQAGKYAYLAAQAYDYETGLLGSDEGRQFLGQIVSSRALGILDENGQPTFSGSYNGDPGLAGLLANMKADWDVVRGRLGFNNPDTYGTTFSLREELFRIPNDPNVTTDDTAWRNLLASYVRENLVADADVATHALQIDPNQGVTEVPGFVIPFSTAVERGKNFFGNDLMAGDHRFSETSFATKIHAAGIVFKGYKGMDPCLVCPHEVPVDTSGHPDALSATPHVYLLPTGQDIMRTPPLGDTRELRRWTVHDYAMPLPYNIGEIPFSELEIWTGRTSLSEPINTPRLHQAFRAVGTPDFFFTEHPEDYTNSRLVGRSVWNSGWKLVIPAIELLQDEDEAIERFLDTVTDIELYLKTYSYSGN